MICQSLHRFVIILEIHRKWPDTTCESNEIIWLCAKPIDESNTMRNVDKRRPHQMMKSETKIEHQSLATLIYWILLLNKHNRKWNCRIPAFNFRFGQFLWHTSTMSSNIHTVEKWNSVKVDANRQLCGTTVAMLCGGLRTCSFFVCLFDTNNKNRRIALATFSYFV